MSCNRKLRFNFQLFYRITIFVLLAAIFRYVIDLLISFDSLIFDIVLFLIFILIPLLSGKSLVLESKNEGGGQTLNSE